MLKGDGRGERRGQRRKAVTVPSLVRSGIEHTLVQPSYEGVWAGQRGEGESGSDESRERSRGSEWFEFECECERVCVCASCVCVSSRREPREGESDPERQVRPTTVPTLMYATLSIPSVLNSGR